MAKKSTTLTGYQRLNNALSGNWGGIEKHTNSYKVSSDNRIFRTTDKDEYEAKKLELAQSRYLAKQWVKTNRNLDLVEAFKGKNNMLLMYTDADFMDSAPEIASALDTISEESTVLSDKGKVITVKSESNRIKAILEDLFENRLDMNIMAPLIVRGMCKYGNQFMLLDIDKENGVKGWRQLPVGEVERIEHGIDPMFLNQQYNSEKSEDMSTKFRWVGIGQGGITEFRNWQVAHFRLITNSMYLPYGVSWLNPARRHFRMLCLMEDMMLIYRLERSMERRVFKIFVGAMDDADIPAYMDEIANNFKRTPIVDPLTGLVDLRKNVLPVHKDTPIPLLDGRTITIEELANEFSNGVSNYVYSIQDETKKIVPGLVKWCGKNYTAEKLYKITLDDNSYTVMAGEHEVIMRDGTKKRADMLCEGESVMPFHKDSKSVHVNEQNVSKIEIVDGDDVYCMTVVGPNNEEDRHNFALRSINNDGSWNDNGIFVSNCTSDDFFIPVRDQSAPSPIETLAGANNLTALDDIKYVQNKVYAGLCVPKQFISFEETTGDGKNLALMDVRFARKINRVQQSFLMELNKIAILHLYILGFHDEISNFKLSMKNPSTQAEMMNVENLAKKISAVRDAVTDPGGGIPILSMKRAVTEFLGFSEKEWKNNLEEIRLEKALAKELEKTDQIIQRSGIFDIVDRIYGEPGAKYAEAQGGQEGGDPMGGGPGGGGGGFGGGLDSIGDMGGEPEGDVPGMEGEMPAADMGGESDAGGAMPADAGGAPPMEGVDSSKPLIDERGKNGTEFKLGEGFIINKNIDDMIRKVDEYIEK